jgi:hypothetical protein
MKNDTETASEALRFPRGVRFARPEDVPRSARDAVERSANVQISAGFVAKTCENAGYSSYLEANIHADQVWAVFEALAESLLPEIVAPLVAWKDAEPIFGPHTNKSAVLAVLRPHKDSLQHDGYIEFGLMSQTDQHTEEIFVKAAKHMQVWTNRSDIAESTFVAMGVPRVDRLRFIDEFPRVTERLADGAPSSETISAIISAFERLPAR